MMKKIALFALAAWVVLLSFPQTGAAEKESIEERLLDKRVRAFLERRQGTWTDMNVPASDGRILYDIIVRNGYTRALEIGTSTGHSAIWIAWALSKTNGKLITIEIDERRHKKALANFEAAGLKDFIDARLADARVLVNQLEGPFDFVFSDADKEWYKQYFIDIFPKLETGGVFTAHNVWGRKRGRGWMSGTEEFYEYIVSLPNMATTVDTSGAGMSISYKTGE
jgi:caffeoyl-CoA O-methyltransferase